MRPPNVWHGNENECWSGNDQSLRCDGVNAAGVSLVPARLRSAAMVTRLTNRPYSHKDFLKSVGEIHKSNGYLTGNLRSY